MNYSEKEPENKSGLFFLLLVTPFILFGIYEGSNESLERFEFSEPHMGTEFYITLYAENAEIAESAADSAFRRVEELNQILSDYHAESELNRLSATSGSGEEISVSDPLWDVINKGFEISEKTGGAFDMTIGPFVSLWRDLRDDPDPQLPDSTLLQETSKSVGYELIELDEQEQTVRLTASDMQLDPGGIAKGYAVDEALAVLRHYGITSAMVNGGGDISIGEQPPNRKGWDVQIYSDHPRYKDTPLILTLSNQAVTTSGDLFQYIEIDGTRYSHIIDPETGLGLTEGRKATVVGEKGISVDAYATAFTVLPSSESLEIAESCDNLATYIEVTKEDTIATYESTGFKKLKKQGSENK